MRRARTLSLGLMVVVSACGSGGAEGGADESSDPADPGASTQAGGAASASAGSVGAGPGGGAVVNPQPPGQATISVDGLDYTFQEPGPVACSIGDGYSWSFRIGDGVTLVGGGQDLGEYGWGGSIELTVIDEEPDPDSGELGSVSYRVALPEIDGATTMAFDGSSMSYSGPMWKQVSGSDPPGEDVGTATVSVTCS